MRLKAAFFQSLKCSKKINKFECTKAANTIGLAGGMGSGELKSTAKANKVVTCSKYTRKKNLRTQELPGYIFFLKN